MNLSALVPLVIFGSACAHAQDRSGDEQAVIDRSQAWIEQGWSPKDDTENFSFENLRRFYDLSDDIVAHDTNDPQMRVFSDARTYVGTLAPFIASQSYLDNEWTGLKDIRVDGDLAIIAFTADAIFRTEDNVERRVPHFYSLGWQRAGDGQWRIVHEHGSSMELPEE